MHRLYIDGIEPSQVGYYLLRWLSCSISLSTLVLVYLFGISPPALTRSSDINTLEWGVTCFSGLTELQCGDGLPIPFSIFSLAWNSLPSASPLLLLSPCHIAED